MRKEYLPMVAGKHFPKLEKMLAQSGSGFILPSGISYADFRIVSFIDMIKPVEVQAKYPKLMEYVDRVNGLPQLREYMSKRKL
jgi:glutathione S-transferase